MSCSIYFNQKGAKEMKLVAHFQYRENYGAHNWNGEGECPQHWKYKGGDTVILRTFSTQDAVSVAIANNFTQLVKDIIAERELEWRNEASEQYLLDWEIIEDDEFTVVWDDPKDVLGNRVSEMIFDRDDLDYQGSICDVNNRSGYYFIKKEQ
jgi:hypothetical protein